MADEKQYIADSVKAAASPSGVVLAAVVLICVLGVITVKLFFDMTLSRLDNANKHADEAVKAMERINSALQNVENSLDTNGEMLNRIAGDVRELARMRMDNCRTPAAYTIPPKESNDRPFSRHQENGL